MQLHYPSAGSWLSHWRTLEGETIIYLSTSTSVAMSSWHQTQLTLAINCLSGSSAVLYRGLSFHYRIHWCSDCPYGLYLHYIDPGVDKMLIVQPAALPSRLAFETLDVSWALAHLGLNWVDCSVKDLIAPALNCGCPADVQGLNVEAQQKDKSWPGSASKLWSGNVCMTEFLEEWVVMQLVRVYMIYGWSMNIYGMWKC